MARAQSLVVILLFCFIALSVAFSREDHDIFRLRDEVEQTEGEGATFYSFLGVDPSATLDELKRANRKRSKQLHPDKAVASILAARTAARASSRPNSGKKPGVTVRKGPSQKERAEVSKEATARYQRLSTVAEILMSPSRERYDHFMKNGFPRWRGSGYYYARFRPGLGSVLVGLAIVFGGAAHYGALYVSWKRQKDFVERYIKHARQTAWGNDGGIPGVPGMNGNGAAPPTDDFAIPEGGMALNRRQKRMQEKESKRKETPKTARSARNRDISSPTEPEMISGPQGTKKKVVAENGKVLIVDSVGNVYLEDTTVEGETHEFLLDPDEIPQPTIFQTALFRLPIWLYSKTAGRFLGAKQDEVLLTGEEFEVNIDGRASEIVDSAAANSPREETKKRKSKAKAL